MKFTHFYFNFPFIFMERSFYTFCLKKILLFLCLYHFRDITCFVYSYFARFFILVILSFSSFFYSLSHSLSHSFFPFFLLFFPFKSSFQGQYTTGTTSIYATHIHIENLSVHLIRVRWVVYDY